MKIVVLLADGQAMDLLSCCAGKSELLTNVLHKLAPIIVGFSRSRTSSRQFFVRI
jgi:hypothetical protein